MTSSQTIACFGAAHWDYVGQADPGHTGPDRPGSVRVRPGGVAANVAMGLAARGLNTELLSIVGGDGKALLATLGAAGVGTALTLVSDVWPTGRYIAVEDRSGELICAVADCRILEDLAAGAFDTVAVEHAGYWFVEANLPTTVIEDLAAVERRPPLIANPVSPARAARLCNILHRIAILYCNRAEAEVLCGGRLPTNAEAARALLSKGVGQAVVTDGPGTVCDASDKGIFSADPERTGFVSATGAGDAFLSRHLAAGLAGADPMSALHAAVLPQGGGHD